VTPAADAARRVLSAAIADGVTPGAAVDVGCSSGTLWRASLGAVAFDADAQAVRDDTPYDLASLTKPMVTTTLVAALAAEGLLALDSPIAAYQDEWRGADRERVTVRDLLEHASGLPARLVDAPPEGRRAFAHDIGQSPLEYAPRTASVYSDLGFILLGFLTADAGGRAIAEQFEVARRALAAAEPELMDGVLGFARSPSRIPDAAPTLPLDDDRRRGRRLAGDVHDTYAAALGGVAGHAGLFGTATTVGAFARAALRSARGDRAVPAPLSPELVARVVTPSAVPGSSRALGWDTMRPTSSCGTRMSAAAFGHVGFTGTSVWIDPLRDRYFVLLANRVCGTAPTDAMQAVRRAFHDALADL